MNQHRPAGNVYVAYGSGLQQTSAEGATKNSPISFKNASCPTTHPLDWIIMTTSNIVDYDYILIKSNGHSHTTLSNLICKHHKIAQPYKNKTTE